MKRQLTFGTRQIQFQKVICFKLIGLITHLINKEGQLFEEEEKTLQTNAFQLVKLYSSASASNTFLVQAAILAKIQLAFWVFFSSYDVFL